MKKNEMKLAFCKGDILAIGLVLAIAILVGVFFWTSVGEEESSVAVVYQDGQRIKELSLSEDAEFVVEGAYTNKIVVENGRAAITESDCPGTDCVHSGWIHEAGRSIVCLPNRVEIRLEGASEVDFVVR